MVILSILSNFTYVSFRYNWYTFKPKIGTKTHIAVLISVIIEYFSNKVSPDAYKTFLKKS
jgi:hypothetical protein